MEKTMHIRDSGMFANNYTSHEKTEDYDLQLIAKRMRAAYVKTMALSASQQQYIIKVYLNYLLYTKVITAQTTSELQVFIYKLAREIYDEFDTREAGNCGNIMTRASLSDSKKDNLPNVTLNSPDNRVASLNHKQIVSEKLISQLLSPYDRLPSEIQARCNIGQELRSQLKNYVTSSDKAFEFVLDNISDRLLAAMDAKLTPTEGFYAKLYRFFLPKKMGKLEKQYRLLKMYHQKGLLKRDCKRMYKREIIKYVSE